VITITSFLRMRMIYEEWTQVIEARPRYINIMSGLIPDEDD
jgi:hypothetical protein